MLNRTRSLLLAIAACVMASVLLYQPAAAGDFVADMVQQDMRDTTISKIYVRGTVYRIETEEEGAQIIVLVDQEANVTTVCHMDQNACFKIASDDIQSLMSDPFMSLKVTKETPGTEAKELEPEEINGIECAAHVILWGETPFYTYFVSEKYSLPLKMIRGDGVQVVELKNIEEKEIDDAMFAVPEGFTVEEPPGEVNDLK
jgi:hypothetical protein